MRLDLTLHSILVYLRVLTLLHEIHPYIAKANDPRFERKLLSISQSFPSFNMLQGNQDFPT